MTLLPNFLIIGAARSGTTAVARALGQHPDVFMTTPKETHFFAHPGQSQKYAGPGDEEMINSQLITDPDAYLRLYDRASSYRARGEGSVSTLFRPEVSIDAIRRFADPDVRLIAILREPAERAYSSYLYLRGRGFERAETFAEGLRLEPERTADNFHHMWRYEAMSRYADQLPAFQDEFGDRLQVHIFEEYRSSPTESLQRMCQFLDIDSEVAFDTELNVNRGGVPRSRLLSRAMGVARSSSSITAMVKRLTPYSMRERIRAANLSRPNAEEATLTALRDRCRGDVRAVESALGRDIPLWTDR